MVLIVDSLLFVHFSSLLSALPNRIQKLEYDIIILYLKNLSGIVLYRSLSGRQFDFQENWVGVEERFACKCFMSMDQPSLVILFLSFSRKYALESLV